MSNKLGNIKAVLCAALVASGASALTDSALAAQEGTAASLAGLVFDSTKMAPLAGARVAVMGTNSVSTTDESGRFLLSDVPAGDYGVADVIRHDSVAAVPDVIIPICVLPGAFHKSRTGDSLFNPLRPEEVALSLQELEDPQDH